MSNVFDIGGSSPEPQQRVNINLSDAQDITCDKCGGHFFHSVTLFKKLSALVSPNGQESLIPIETYACTECGNVNKEFLPRGFSFNG